MKYRITYFYNLRFLKPNQIPISTAYWDPKWIRERTQNNAKPYVDENNIMIGLKEESLIIDINSWDSLDEQCQRDCPYRYKIPNCGFMREYTKQLEKIDFDGYLIPELTRVAEDVRKITHYEGEPEIVLLVHEKPDVPCAERPCLVKLFKEHGLELREWSKEDSDIIF